MALIAAEIISIHPPRAGRDCIVAIQLSNGGNFNPPAPCGAGPKALCDLGVCVDISIHPPRAGRDSVRHLYAQYKGISIHPPRAGRDIYDAPRELIEFISIHPPRAGRDLRICCNSFALFLISIHPPRAGRDFDVGRV